MKQEETLCESKKEAQKQAKCQLGTKKIIARRGVLQADEAADRIRCKEEVEHTWHRSLLKGRRGNVRKAFKRKLDFLTVLNDPNRSIPRAEQAVSL
jgi:hypothetical protein